MQWIKIPLVVLTLLVLVTLFRNRARVEMRAGTRVAALVMFGVAVASIIDPDLTQRAAELVGVTRGADLLLYVLVVVFAFTSLGLYFRLREADLRLRRLARAIAIDMALRDGEPGDHVEPGEGRPPVRPSVPR